MGEERVENREKRGGRREEEEDEEEEGEEEEEILLVNKSFSSYLWSFILLVSFLS